MYAQVLWELAEQKPLDKITVSDVIARAGTARQTFYDHFSDKDSLLNYVLELWVQIATKGFPAEKTWLECMMKAAAFASEHKAFFSDYLDLQGQRCFPMSRVFSNRITELVEANDGQVSSSLKLMIFFYSYGLSGTFYSWIKYDNDRSIDELARVMYECMPPELKDHLGGMVVMKQEQMGGIEAVLASRFYLYQVFHLVFGSEPTHELLEVLGSEQTSDTVKMFIQDTDEADMVCAYLQGLAKRAENPTFLSALKSEYARLFVGPEKQPAYPWESAYMGKEAMLFQESTLKVRQYYTKYGYRTLVGRHMADDHIGLMMDFMSNMSQRTYGAFHMKAYGKALEFIGAQRSFLNEHLRSWIPHYAERLTNQRDPLFYAQCTTLLCEALDTDDRFLKEIADEMREYL